MTGFASAAKGAPRDARAVMASRDPTADTVDFFPTPPWGARAGGELIKRLDPQASTAWECAAGAGHMAHGLADYFDEVFESDAYDYGRGKPLFDFAKGPAHPAPWRADWIVSNPPFALIDPFVRLAYARATRGVALLMRLAVLEGQARYRLLHEEAPLYATAPFSERLPMQKGRWDPTVSTASAYAWFFWLKPAAGGPSRFRPAPEPRLLTIAPGAMKRLSRPSDRKFAASAATSASALQPYQLAALRELAKWPTGACGMPGVLNGGVLAGLVQLGLADRVEEGALGGNRYAIAPDGKVLLAGLRP